MKLACSVLLNDFYKFRYFLNGGNNFLLWSCTSIHKGKDFFSFNSEEQQVSQKSAKENKLIYFLLFHHWSQIKIDTKEENDESWILREKNADIYFCLVNVFWISHWGIIKNDVTHILHVFVTLLVTLICFFPSGIVNKWPFGLKGREGLNDYLLAGKALLRPIMTMVEKGSKFSKISWRHLQITSVPFRSV